MTLRTTFFAVIFASLVPGIAWTGTPAATQSGSGDDKVALERGRELFTREWIAGDRRSHGGDGLGPVYNAQSCVACHRLGGIGGAGDQRDEGVSLVSLFVGAVHDGPMFITGIMPAQAMPLADARKKVVAGPPGQQVELEIPSQDELAKIHPALRTAVGFTFALHRFGVGPEFAKWRSIHLSKGQDGN